MTSPEETAAERQKAEYEADLEIQKETLKAMLEVAKGSLARSQTSADFVQKVATALAGVYTTLLAVVFSIKDNPLPPRGFIPTLFFAASAGLAAAYLAFLTKPEVTRTTTPSNLPRLNSLKKVTTFITWTNRAVMRRARFLRAAVVALFLGIAFLPIALITNTPSSASDAAITSGASIAPTPTPAWPSPPASATTGELELYKAQLQAHVAALASPSATSAPSATDQTENAGVDAFAFVLAAIGGIVVLAVALDWTRRGRASSNDDDGIPGPAITAE